MGDASIHFPLAREDELNVIMTELYDASIHFPLAREDTEAPPILPVTSSFNPLPSCEGRQNHAVYDDVRNDASIHFPLAREDMVVRSPRAFKDASIHFPLAREDFQHPVFRRYFYTASIHIPHAREVY